MQVGSWRAGQLSPLLPHDPRAGAALQWWQAADDKPPASADSCRAQRLGATPHGVEASLSPGKHLESLRNPDAVAVWLLLSASQCLDPSVVAQSWLPKWMLNAMVTHLAGYLCSKSPWE